MPKIIYDTDYFVLLKILINNMFRRYIFLIKSIFWVFYLKLLKSILSDKDIKTEVKILVVRSFFSFLTIIF